MFKLHELVNVLYEGKVYKIRIVAVLNFQTGKKRYFLPFPLKNGGVVQWGSDVMNGWRDVAKIQGHRYEYAEEYLKKGAYYMWVDEVHLTKIDDISLEEEKIKKELGI